MARVRVDDVETRTRAHQSHYVEVDELVAERFGPPMWPPIPDMHRRRGRDDERTGRTTAGRKRDDEGNPV